MTTIFEKDYDGESIVDVFRDVREAFDPTFTPAAAQIPTGQYGFQKGTFTVKVEWVPEGGIE